MNEIVTDSDSDTDNIPEFWSGEESESESANESNISIPTTGFSKNGRQPRIPPVIGNPVVQFAVENEADVMSYFDHYILPELIEIVVDQSRQTGVAKKKPKCVIVYNTHVHGVDTVDQYLAYYPLICKTVKWPKKVFFYLQCCLFNSYVTFSKNNPSSANHS